MIASMLLSVFLMGVVGSWHCGVMCSPLSCSFRGGGSFVGYHVGRLCAYALLTVVMYNGAHFFLQSDSRVIKMIASVFFVSFFVLFGVLKMRNCHVSLIPKRYTFLFNKKMQPLFKKSPFLLGLLTVSLPCGWLYSFLVLSAQMPTLSGALGLTVIFWISSLPIFFAVNTLMSGLILKSGPQQRKLAGLVLIFAGLLSVLSHWSEVIFL